MRLWRGNHMGKPKACLHQYPLLQPRRCRHNHHIRFRGRPTHINVQTIWHQYHRSHWPHRQTPWFQRMLQNMQDQHHLIHLILLSQENQTTPPSHRVPVCQSGLPQVGEKVDFGIYKSCDDALIANALPLLVGKIATELGCTTSSLSIFSFLTVHLLPNIKEAFSDNASYADKKIDMWYQVCKIQYTRNP